jgi:hypothetical protein
MRLVQWVLCVAFLILVVSPVRAQQDPFAPVGESLIVQPTAEADAAVREVESVLAGGLQPAAAQGEHDFCQCVGETNSASVSKIEQALAGQLKTPGLDFADTPLEEVVALLQEEYGIPVQLDQPAMEEIGIDTQEPVTVNLHGISLRSALRLMLKRLQLTYIIQDEVLLITTPESAESELMVCVYDVRDLVDGPKDQAGIDALVETIVECVRTETWSANGGGEAEIRSVKQALLVISQTRAVHEEIRGLLETVRQVRKQSPASAEDATKSAVTDPDPNQVVSRPYYLSLGQPANPEEVRSQIKNLIVNSLPDEKWEGRLADGQPVLLTILPDRIVLRHMPAVHEKVESLLVDSGVATPPQPAHAFGRGGSFGGGGMSGGGFFQLRATLGR